ncbi:hypothetical protein HUU62_18350 [Rhodoferax sp. 4810]|nr:hypothetical protein [Rhodoferax jenense]
MSTEKGGTPLVCHRHCKLSLKVFGVGGAGCNLLVALKSNDDLPLIDYRVEWICIDLGMESLMYAKGSSKVPDDSPIQALSLAPFGSGGRVDLARAAALRHIEALKALIIDAEVVVLLASLGGGTGGGVAPIMSHLARAEGASVLVTVVTPFEFEDVRNGMAASAIQLLTRETDLVVCFSNQELAEGLGDDVLMDVIFAAQDRRIAAVISDFLAKRAR